jgi:hypothetical protein
MARPSDLWAPFKREWYNDETGELQEPHRSRLIANGTSLVRIAEMEAEVRAEIANFHQMNADRPLVNGKNWAEQQLELRQRRSQLPKSMQSALHHGTFDPDKNYE